MRPSDSVCGVDRRAYSDVVFAAVTSSSSSSSICGCSDAVARRAASVLYTPRGRASAETSSQVERKRGVRTRLIDRVKLSLS